MPLLVARVGRADDAHDAVAPDDLAVAADFLDRCQNFHVVLQKRLYLARNVIRALDRSYGVSSTVTLSPGRILM